MTLTDRHNRIECIDQLIRQRRTGPAKKIAEHLCVHERTVFEELDLLRSWGADIRWDAKRHSYYYVRPGRFRFGWFPDEE